MNSQLSVGRAQERKPAVSLEIFSLWRKQLSDLGKTPDNTPNKEELYHTNMAFRKAIEQQEVRRVAQ